jgi:menaquinone-dependent protoporphyrinogen IX oxidase
MLSRMHDGERARIIATMRLGRVIMAAVLGAGAYATLLRRAVLDWGATSAEARGRLPGDELLERADGVSTRAIDIDAPAAAVWPWLVQMGPRPRGGAYTYDWIENLLGLDMHSADVVLEEFQHPAVGTTIGYGANRMRLQRIDPERVLAWRSQDGNWVWSFVLEPLGAGRTRLLSRNRFRLPTPAMRLAMLPMEPASLVMEHRMLLGIRARAERLASDGGACGEGACAVLVAYASRYGSTRGVALRIAERLRERGLAVEVAALGEQEADPTVFDAVVLGSAVFDQRWLPAAERFARRHGGVLAKRATWLFTVGSFGDTKRLIGPLMRREPRDIAALRRLIAPRGYRVFAGSIRREQWPLASRAFYRSLGGRLGDNRDWAAIDAWAASIADACAPAPAGRAGRLRITT